MERRRFHDLPALRFHTHEELDWNIVEHCSAYSPQPRPQGMDKTHKVLPARLDISSRDDGID